MPSLLLSHLATRQRTDLVPALLQLHLVGVVAYRHQVSSLPKPLEKQWNERFEMVQAQMTDLLNKPLQSAAMLPRNLVHRSFPMCTATSMTMAAKPGISALAGTVAPPIKSSWSYEYIGQIGEKSMRNQTYQTSVLSKAVKERNNKVPLQASNGLRVLAPSPLLSTWWLQPCKHFLHLHKKQENAGGRFRQAALPPTAFIHQVPFARSGLLIWNLTNRPFTHQHPFAICSPELNSCTKLPKHAKAYLNHLKPT